MRTLSLALLALLLIPATAAEAAKKKKPPGMRIHVVSNRADVLSAGDALVRIELRKPIRVSRIRVTAGASDVTRAFAKRRNGRVEGLVTGLKVGRTVLRAQIGSPPTRRAARAALEKAFPNGVCDWSRPGVEQQPTIPWQRYQDPGGAVVYGGRPLGAAPKRSGAGWSSRAFAGWRAARVG